VGVGVGGHGGVCTTPLLAYSLSRLVTYSLTHLLAYSLTRLLAYN
jgi:hypothetical protein